MNIYPAFLFCFSPTIIFYCSMQLSPCNNVSWPKFSRPRFFCAGKLCMFVQVGTKYLTPTTFSILLNIFKIRLLYIIDSVYKCVDPTDLQLRTLLSPSSWHRGWLGQEWSISRARSLDNWRVSPRSQWGVTITISLSQPLIILTVTLAILTNPTRTLQTNESS